MELEGRIAIVTGAGRGIGREIALQFAKEGAKVVVVDNGAGIAGSGSDPSVAEKVVDAIGGSAFAWSGDITEVDAAESLVQSTLRRFGSIDILVNNAGILRPGLIFKSDKADWDRTIEVNLTACYRLLAATSKVMRQQYRQGRGGEAGWGRVVNMGSTVSFYGNPGQGAYAASKAGLFGLTRVAALELAPCKINCNLVAPFAGTRVSEAIETDNEEMQTHRNRMRELGPEHVAPVITWLCSDRAAHISGQAFSVKGNEVTLFSQPRPLRTIIATSNVWESAALADRADAAFGDNYTELISDRSVFVQGDII